LQLGGPGCITATANVNATAIARVVELFDQGDVDAAQQAHEVVRQTRLTIQEHAPIPAQKRLLAIQTGDARWANVRPPLSAMSESDGENLAAALKRE